MTNGLVPRELNPLVASQMGCRCGSAEAEEAARSALLSAINELAKRAHTTTAVQSLVSSYATLMGATAGASPGPPSPAT
ncbi:hypothetical protein BH09ACT8_BH09ACT8_20680 [soil metagenome]